MKRIQNSEFRGKFIALGEMWGIMNEELRILFSVFFAVYSEVLKIDLVKLPDQNKIMLTTEANITVSSFV